jgi:hypothetical protein
MENKEKEIDMIALDDDQLEAVSGGYNAGDVVNITPFTIQYCNGCGKLMHNFPVTITGVRGVLDGVTLYWVRHCCCGYKSSISERSIR